MNIRLIRIVFFTLFISLGVGLSAQNTDQRLASQYYDDKEYDKAAVYYEKLYRKNDHVSYYSNLLDCYRQLKAYKEGKS